MGVRFIYHEYDYRSNWMTQSHMINHKNFIFQEKNKQILKESENRQRRCKLVNVALKLRFVDLNYNFECDWLIQLSDNNLASDLVENRSFSNQLQSKKLEFF